MQVVSAAGGTAGAAAADELAPGCRRVREQLKRMEDALCPGRDHRGIFAALYRLSTDRALEAIESYRAQGDAKVVVFLRRLVINFAEKYFQAFADHDRGHVSRVPEPWRVSFDAGRLAQAMGYGRLGAARVLFLSMNAHIVHDLPFTLKEIGFADRGRAPDPDLEDAYDRIGAALYAARGDVVRSIEPRYGRLNLELLEGPLGAACEIVAPGALTRARAAAEERIFNLSRHIAKDAAIHQDAEQTRRMAVRYTHTINFLLGGGYR